jgi:hypothetical protein
VFIGKAFNCPASPLMFNCPASPLIVMPPACLLPNGALARLCCNLFLRCDSCLMRVVRWGEISKEKN